MPRHISLCSRWAITAALSIVLLAPFDSAFAGTPSPSDVSVTQGRFSVSLTWLAPSSGDPIINYEISRTQGSDVGSVYCETADASTAAECVMMAELGLRPGPGRCTGVWYYWVRAITTSGPTDWSEAALANYQGLCVQATGGDEIGEEFAARASGNRIEIAWPKFANVKPTVAYNVYRATTPTGERSRINTAPLAATTRRFVDANVASGAVYFYQVAAVDATGGELLAAPMIAGTATPVGEPTFGASSEASTWGGVKGLYR